MLTKPCAAMCHSSAQAVAALLQDVDVAVSSVTRPAPGVSPFAPEGSLFNTVPPTRNRQQSTDTKDGLMPPVGAMPQRVLSPAALVDNYKPHSKPGTYQSALSTTPSGVDVVVQDNPLNSQGAAPASDTSFVPRQRLWLRRCFYCIAG